VSVVRLATPADVPRVLAMMVDFNRFEGIAWSPAVGEAPLRRLIADSSLGAVGVVDDGRAGYFVLTWGFDLEWDGRDAFLTELWLVPEARGRGVGAEVLAEIQRIAKESGARALHLMVRNENANARRLYERAGFTSPPRVFLSKDLRD
jgi:ribosomal protein S18 acetylase RimI-like enzyme